MNFLYCVLCFLLGPCYEREKAIRWDRPPFNREQSNGSQETYMYVFYTQTLVQIPTHRKA